MLPFKLVYHERYFLNLGEHVFPAQKYRYLRDRLLRTRFAEEADFVEPEPATDDDVRLVHDPDWVAKLRTGTLSYADILRLEIPYSRQMVEAFWLAAGGIAAGRAAGTARRHRLQHRRRLPSRLSRDTARVSARSTMSPSRCAACRPDGVDPPRHGGRLRRASRQRHGRHLHGDLSVFTLSIHQFNNYPSEKPLSSLDIHLPDGIGDASTCSAWATATARPSSMFQPELVMYVAGADPYQEDQLGGLSLTFGGMEERDRLVIRTAREHGVPVAIVLAGGYAQSVEDTHHHPRQYREGGQANMAART